MMTITTALLIDHPDAIEGLTALLDATWPDWYNPRGASARTDLSERMRRDGLPLGIVALGDGNIVGTCALTATSGGMVTERSPWLSGLVVAPKWRRHGVATALLGRARTEARRLGQKRVYALTASADPLLAREGWAVSDVLLMSGEPHRIFMAVA
ncbi:GNAT family N-acetyltransferase [Devosia epidermidihirudinis]|uniref:GNAT family N-acetyltransferase n=1 Tax=Devosia epidermidihirudinis TaxID=1293439 RepID=UPI000698392B|nr:GNAT family N-acetyltransferase [Devosia epidermidihirudinis]